jgi:hypothetical protein
MDTWTVHSREIKDCEKTLDEGRVSGPFDNNIFELCLLVLFGSRLSLTCKWCLVWHSIQYGDGCKMARCRQQCGCSQSWNGMLSDTCKIE